MTIGRNPNGPPALPAKLQPRKMDSYLGVLKPITNMTDNRPKRQRNVRDKYSAVYVNQDSLVPSVAENTPVDSDITHYVWYHDKLSRETAHSRLMDRHVDGMFLVRRSSQAEFPFALSLFYQGKVYNFKIRGEGGHFFLGEKRENEPAFASVPELVVHFQTDAIILHRDRSLKATLVRPLPQ